MNFYLIGINYKSAPINVRDEVQRNKKAISDFWLKYNPGSFAILATCNRLEIYIFLESYDESFDIIQDFLDNFPMFSRYAYLINGKDLVFHHAVRLAIGLESQIQGEQQILEQIKEWRTDNSFPYHLKELWDKAIFVSREIRAASGLNKDNVNIATLVLSDLERKLSLKQRYEIVIIGTGKIAQILSEYKLPKANYTFLANKNYKRAVQLARLTNGKSMFLKDLNGLLVKADALICATSSPHYILNKSNFDKNILRRKSPLYIYDLAIPRDVDPQVGDIEGICLQNLDNLENIFNKYNDSIKVRIELASNLITKVLESSEEFAYAR